MDEKQKEKRKPEIGGEKRQLNSQPRNQRRKTCARFLDR